MSDIRIVSGWIREDGVETGRRAGWLNELGQTLPPLEVETLRIRSLADGWEPDTEHEFGSGAGPVCAVERAIQILADPSSSTDIVVIRGAEPLRSGYDSETRRERMQIYDGVSIPEGYDRVARHFIDDRQMTRPDFLAAARQLEKNCRLSAEARGLEFDPPGTHDQFVTDLFRRVDCAHPLIDFEGELVLTTSDAAENLGFGGPMIVACETAEVPDGPANVAQIAQFDHLRQLLAAVAARLGRLPEPLTESVHLELYTCFPVVPLAFLEAAGWAEPDDVEAFLQAVPIAVSGGMNFARAPWNNPALRGLVLVSRRVREMGGTGLVHGNGGLGAKQGVCIIEP